VPGIKLLRAELAGRFNDARLFARRADSRALHDNHVAPRMFSTLREPAGGSPSHWSRRARCRLMRRYSLKFADLSAVNAADRCHPGDCFAIATVRREGDARPLTVLAAKLETVRAPARVRPIDRGAAVVPSVGVVAGRALEWWLALSTNCGHPYPPRVPATDAPPRRIVRLGGRLADRDWEQS
jgi:hypothetical protein